MSEKKSIDSRYRNFACVVYPESAPDNWQSILSDHHISAFISPLHDKDIDEITGRDKKIRELEARKDKMATPPELSSDECYVCGKKGTTMQTCVKCKKAVCEDCATFVPETESEVASGYYCQDCW